MKPGTTLRRLGTMALDRFLAQYWQREPLCVRQAIDGFVPALGRADLFALAASADVESRLVSAFSGRWRVQHGPFARSSLPAPGRAGWTLLVQGVDLHDGATAALAARFRFLPAARFDDVMISYASAGGGVGPHVDQYDVFLLQAQGRRRWRIAKDYDPQLVEGMPLRVLANFRHEREWTLEPGDLLYLPPGVAHEGVALDPCITVSIGFRLPPWQEIAEAWHERQGRVAPLDGRVPDKTRSPTRAPARLPAELIDAAQRKLRANLPTRSQTRRTLLEHLSEPKPSVVFGAPRPALPLAGFVRALRQRGAHADLCTRMLYAGTDFAINGELQPAISEATKLLRTLADQGMLDAKHFDATGDGNRQELLALLHGWYRAGWLHLGGKWGYPCGNAPNAALRKL